MKNISMKYRFISIAVIGSVFLLSCNNKSTGISETAQKNLNAEKSIRELIASKNLDSLDEYISPDCIDHSGFHGDVRGLDSIKAQFRMMMAMASEKTEIVKELADDDYIMSWEHNTGEYITTGYGHKPGDKFDLQEMEVVRFRDGKAVEHWSMMPPADVMKMMATTAAPVTMDNAVIHEDSLRVKNGKAK
jgi:predicted SnoaL-like aldol condensation-catalyzing enzyme